LIIMKKIFMLLGISSLFFLGFYNPNQGILKTSLEITIRNRLGNIVQGCEVQLFGDRANYENGTNPISEPQTTDKKGKVLFKELEPLPYFIRAEKGKLNNFGEGEMVDTLISGRRNKVNLIIR
ncbi:carboxypeptidase regulatory-like domain-containing protein, partial [Bacteroidota bacterium]